MPDHQPDNAIEVRGLQKIYKGSKEVPPFEALILDDDDSSMDAVMYSGEVFIDV